MWREGRKCESIIMFRMMKAFTGLAPILFIVLGVANWFDQKWEPIRCTDNLEEEPSYIFEEKM